MTIERIISILRPLRLTLADEKRLQCEMADAFTAAGLPFEREVRLSQRDVIDFVLDGGTGIEVKVKGGKRDIFHQVERYAEHDAISELLLVTNVPMGMPEEVCGKPVYVHHLFRAWL